MRKIPILIFMLCLCTMTAYSQRSQIDSLVETGVRLHDAGRYAEAITVYKQALAVDSTSSLVQYELSNTYFEMKQYDLAVAYASKVISNNSPEIVHAYIIKGSALDMQEKLDEALVTYKEGLKKFPSNYLLNYNTALTYFKQKQYSDAEGYAIDAIKANSNHASSHIILGYCKYMQDHRSQSLLAWYYFLMLEPGSQRAANVYALIKKQMVAGVKKKSDNSIDISVPHMDEKDEFSASDLMISMLAAAQFTEDNKNKTEEELFISSSESFFKICGQLKENKEKNKDIWWDFYVPFFYALAKADHTATLCYYISAAESDAASDWIKSHETEVKAFSKWYDKYNDK